MIYTARQIEDLWKAGGSNGQVVLPYRARLSPLAAEWVKAKRIALGYADDAAVAAKPGSPTVGAPLTPALSQAEREANAGGYLWWCDGPCGTAKAALMAQARESKLSELPVPSNAGQLVRAIGQIAAEMKAGRTAGAVMIVQSGAAAVVYANRCPSLRAIVGTSREAVEQGIQAVAANVLIIEHPQKTLQQVRNLLSRFARAKRELGEETRRSLAELSSCA